MTRPTLLLLALLAPMLLGTQCHDGRPPIECSGLAMSCGIQTACDMLPPLTCDLADKYNLHHEADWPCDCEPREGE